MSSNDSIVKYVVFGILIAFAIIFAGCIYTVMPVDIWSECGTGMANVFISANDTVKNIKCIALEEELVDKKEIILNDLSKGDEDVCKFKLVKETSEPIKFEVHYNGIVKKEVCNWQSYPQYGD